MRATSQNTKKTRHAAQTPAPAQTIVPHPLDTRLASKRPGLPERCAICVYEYLVFYLGYLYFGTGCALVSLLSAALHPLLPDAVGTRLGRWMTGCHFRGFLTLLCASRLVRVDLDALDELRAERSIIIAPNHPCLLDAVLIISRLPQTACIMKADIWDSFFLGGGARLSGYIRNDSAINLVRLSTKELRAGHQLLVFPEGTRTRQPPVNCFKGGFALMAKQSGAEVQTVFIETRSAFLNKGWPLLKKPEFPLVYSARLGKRLRVTGDVKAFVAELESYYREELAASTTDESEASRATAQPVTPRTVP